LAPTTSSAADTDLRTRLTDSLRSRALSLGRTGAIALDARTGANRRW